ncbi:MAG TPA: ParB/RepB/Spo0J family partition protein [Acidimicrobiales bacterium]|nr:ParB/RepB/Spo0J family partition protein [Acidimicrobiales bacterium]
MARRSGLGRGLGALIPPEVRNDPNSVLQELPVSSIEPNPHQPRSHFDDEALASLTDSIRSLGVLQPVLVRPLGEDRYELIAGERRWRAARRAGLQTIPALVRTVENRTSLEHALVENLHRQDLNPLEEAGAYQQLIEDFNLTHEEIGVRVGKSRVAISNSLRLLQLPASIQRMVVDGQLTAGHARAILGTPDRAYQEWAARRVVAEALSVRAAEEMIRQRNERAEPASDPAAVAARRVRSRLPEPGVPELERLLADHLGTRVKVQLGPRRGRVTIEFADLEDLERIYRLMVPGS